MYQPKLEKDVRCPLEYGLAVFGGKWKSRIICVLAEKKVLRYSALRREMTDIADPVLAAALRELMEDGVVQRRQYEEIPPRVEYSLTDRGVSAVPILQSICRWSGACYRSGSKTELAQCRKCDYNAAGGENKSQEGV
jgi:DNA-binding HxlR family transcriptional regulator